MLWHLAVPKIDTLSNKEMDILKENIQQYIPLKQVHRVSSKDNSLFALRNDLNGEKVTRPEIFKKIFEVKVAMTDKPYEFKELVYISFDWLGKHPRKTYCGIYSPLQVWDVIYDNDGASMS